MMHLLRRPRCRGDVMCSDTLCSPPLWSVTLSDDPAVFSVAHKVIYAVWRVFLVSGCKRGLRCQGVRAGVWLVLLREGPRLNSSCDKQLVTSLADLLVRASLYVPADYAVAAARMCRYGEPSNQGMCSSLL